MHIPAWTQAVTLTVTVFLAAPSAWAQARLTIDSTQKSIPLLQPKLDSLKARSARRAPSQTFALYDSAIADLRKSGILDRALNVGDTVPDFALQNPLGDTLTLSGLLRKGPVIIVWYRGGWCPYCSLTLRAWMDVLPQVRELGAQLVAIGPEVPDSSLSTKEKLGVEFEVLSDVGNHVARAFGIVYKVPDPVVASYSRFISLSAHNGDQSNELPLAATHIIGADRVIRYAFLEADYKNRAEPSQVISMLRAMRKR